jgi:hypothetical protein
MCDVGTNFEQMIYLMNVMMTVVLNEFSEFEG